MLKQSLILLAAAGLLQSQEPASSATPSAVGSPRGEDKGEYNYTNSIELGYRWSLVGGDLGEYRSDVNYRNGLRLLSGSFSATSKDGHGKFFDQILLNTLGLGNDPYQSAILRIQKNGLYRYDMTWRLNDYYNPGLTVAGGLHLQDTVQRIQDHEITIFPDSKYRLRAGYARSSQDGPALSTAQEFDTTSVALPVFLNVRREWNEYRLGGDAEIAGFKFTVLRRWDFFKEDTPYNTFAVVSGPSVGVVSDPTVLQNFVRSAPVHGRSPGWLGTIIANHRHWAVNARGSYTRGQNDFVLGEGATGLNRFSQGANRQILVQGDADRPSGAGDLNLTLYPTERLTIVNSTSLNSQHITGPSSYTEFTNGSSLGETINFRYLGIRRITNVTDVNFRVNNWLGVYGGWGYTDRLVRTVEGLTFPPTPLTPDLQQLYDNSNILKTGTVGFRLRPIRPLTASFEAEIGRANNPLTPISDRNYHALNGRIAYRTRTVQLSASYKQVYNVNSISFSADNSHSRNYTASAAWTPLNWFTFDASYVKMHLDTTSAIVFFAGATRPTQQSGFSLYRSNIHAANLVVRLALKRRADLYLGYSITDDTGGDVPPAPSATTDPTGALFASVQTFPLTYQSPSARLSVRITPKLRWNVGYQLYNYNEQTHVFGFNQNFHANTGFTSMLWSF